MLEEITSGVHGFTERAFEDWAPVQLIATADKPLELLWANEYSVFLPQTLAIVRVRDIEDANERIAELKREKAEAVSSLINADRRATQNSQSDYRLLMDGNMRLAIKEGRTIGRDEILTMLRALLPHANPGGMIAIDHCIYTLER